MMRYLIVFLTLISFLIVFPCSGISAESKTFTNEDLEKYKSKRDKEMNEEEKIKESERKQRYKHKEIEMEEKMWENIQGGKKKKVIIEKE